MVTALLTDKRDNFEIQQQNNDLAKGRVLKLLYDDDDLSANTTNIEKHSQILTAL